MIAERMRETAGDARRVAVATPFARRERRAGRRRRPAAMIDWAWIGDHLDELAVRTLQHLVPDGDRRRRRLRDLVRARALVDPPAAVLRADRAARRASSTRSRASPCSRPLVPITGLLDPHRRDPAGRLHAADPPAQHRGRASTPCRRDVLEAADGMGYTRGGGCGASSCRSRPADHRRAPARDGRPRRARHGHRLIGEGGLGQLMLRGFNFGNYTAVYVGRDLTVAARRGRRPGARRGRAAGHALGPAAGS